MRKVLVLASGGLDSTTLMYDYKKNGDHVEALFFDYKQKSKKSELEKLKYHCKKLDIPYHIKDIELNWSSSSITGSGDNLYVEYRNLIFLSYAFSLAQAMGFDVVSYGAIKGAGYVDTSLEFMDNMYKIAELGGIKFETPYCDLDKSEVAEIAMNLGVDIRETHSCNHSNVPCGKCDGCRIIAELKTNFFSPKITYVAEGFQFTDKWKRDYLTAPINEFRLLINNKCNMNCKHCFHGTTQSHREDMTISEIEDVIRYICNEMPTNSIHFAGKEPFINDDIFHYTKLIDELNKDKIQKVRYSVVTNGTRVLHYLDQIAEANFEKVSLSVDSLTKTFIRSYSPLKVIKALLEKEVPLEIFIDVHKHNYMEVPQTVAKLIELGVQQFHVRAVSNIGNATNIYEHLIEPSEYLQVLRGLMKLNIPPTVDLSMSWYKTMIDGIKDDAIADLIMTNPVGIELGGVYVFVGLYDSLMESQATITSDGYLLGTGFEISDPLYYKNSIGNVRDEDINTLINRAKEFYIDKIINKPTYIVKY